jgi:hypothetical protein
MSVKALKKQLMAAIAMVLVAAISLSSATYAWFVNNTQVTATNVNVSAATAYSLLISPKNGNDATWGTTTKMSNVGTLTPVSTVGEVATAAIPLTKAAAKTDSSAAVAAVGIGDGTTVAKGDVRFVAMTKWESNYATGVSEVSKSSEISSSKYFYSETVYLKAAQDGSVYLDKNGIGINWALWDSTSNAVGASKLYTIADFLNLTTISTDGKTGDTKTAIETYNKNLTSAQALLKTLRVGLYVTNLGTDGTGTDAAWHEYQLATSSIVSGNAVNTTGNKDSAADGLTKGVSALNGEASATNSTPAVKENASKKTLTSTTIEDWAIAGSANAVTEIESSAAASADEIVKLAANGVAKVDVYIWMEGCDYDTVAANITSFSGTGVQGLQLGFCLGKVKTT